MTSSLSNFVVGKKVLIFTHSLADVDSFASAAAIYFAFKDKANLKIVVPDHLNVNSQEFAKNLDVPFVKAPKNVSSYDAFLFVDFNSFAMLADMAKIVQDAKKPIMIIDHHESKLGMVKDAEKIIDSSVVSTTELVFSLFNKENVEINEKIALCIASGIITDSAHFMIADHRTFRIMSEVMEKSNKSFLEIISLFSVKEDISEKIAKIKAMRRVRIFRGRDYLFTMTNVNCYAPSAANLLVKAGSDIAFAGSEEKGKIRISGRANNLFTNETEFDLVQNVFSLLKESYGGDCGGHPAAAAYNGKDQNLEELLQECIALSYEYVKNFKGLKENLKEYD